MLTHSWTVSRSTTPGATPAVIVTLDPVAVRPEGVSGDYQGHVEARVFARSASGSGYLTKRANVRRISGTLARVGATLDQVAPALDALLVGIVADIVVSGANIQVSVTGLAATSITWDVDVETRIYHA